ncbi:hypothetical protein C5B42_04875 [Candidatus Cerribacteria bacterium 'Amazon FNV 2010 28 9']|uniref:Type II secretion system protein n=1 Tax=Candidatus Cerribacteria bacterium 'Amazon FNV 2010 28 9' TaxID=2081795 RepID=A0A317JML4_9BACT|nr:MAG: hypothetical protein C5B42_04875 [Candidatus Cerribacteria bacterium 'Amazon FNV 2010 28 9']
MNRRTQSGQTLIEVIIALGLIVMVLITLVAALTLGFRNNQTAKEETLAKDRVREAIEWIRQLRTSMGWDAFYSMVNNDGSTVTYCLDTLPTSVAAAQALTNGQCGNLQPLSGTTNFYRDMTLTIVGTNADEIDVTVTVSWSSGGKNHDSTSTLNIKKWL